MRVGQVIEDLDDPRLLGHEHPAVRGDAHGGRHAQATQHHAVLEPVAGRGRHRCGWRGRRATRRGRQAPASPTPGGGDPVVEQPCASCPSSLGHPASTPRRPADGHSVVCRDRRRCPGYHRGPLRAVGESAVALERDGSTRSDRGPSTAPLECPHGQTRRPHRASGHPFAVGRAPAGGLRLAGIDAPYELVDRPLIELPETIAALRDPDTWAPTSPCPTRSGWCR